MKRKSLILFLLCLSQYCVFSQQSFEIIGRVIDKSTQESIIGAYVQAGEKVTVCNNFGYFNIRVSGGIQTLNVSAIGYSQWNMPYQINKDTIIMVALEEDTILLEDLVITDNKYASPTLNKLSFSQTELVRSPSFFGEPDVFKLLQTLPTAQFGKEGSSGLIVRGGSPDQNLILLDDAPLYSANHLGGFFSVFEPRAIKSLNFYAGGFPARYGGRASSIIDIRSKEADKSDFKSFLDIGTLSTRVVFEIPIKKEKSSMMFSFRRSNLDLLTRPASLLSSDGNFQAGYTLYDSNLKYHSVLSDRDQIAFSYYVGSDLAFSKWKDNKDLNGSKTDEKSSGKSSIGWVNLVSSLKWTHLYQNGIFQNITASASHYQFKIKNTLNSKDRISKQPLSSFSDKFHSSVNDLNLRYDWNKTFGTHQLALGGYFTNHSFVPIKYSLISSKSNGENINSEFGYGSVKSFERVFYLEDEISFERINLYAGIHQVAYHTSGEKYLSLQPRMSANMKISSNWNLHTSYDRMAQFTHLLSNNGGGLPIDLWMPVTSVIKPIQSDLFTFGSTLTRSAYSFNTDVFSKRLRNLIEFKDGATFLGGSEPSWEYKVETNGEGRIKGLETKLSKESGKLQGWISYALTHNERQFPNLNGGQPFPFRYGRLHNISITSSWPINPHLSLSTAWYYHSGDAITLATGHYPQLVLDHDVYKYSLDYYDAHLYSSRNGFRMPAYHRLDITLIKTKHLRKSIREFQLGIYNAYNRKNTYYLFLETESNGQVKLKSVTLFPFLPFVSWSWKFK